MNKANKIKIVLLQTFCSVLLCIILITIKYVFQKEELLEELYNYLISDIVFQH